MCLNSKIYKCLVSHLTNMSNFHSLEVVDRGSETQHKPPSHDRDRNPDRSPDRPRNVMDTHLR